MIYEYDQRDEPIYFSKLLKVTGWEKSKVSRLTDKLMDYEIIYGTWEKTPEDWKYCFHIDEDMEGFVKNLYNTSC